MSCWCFIVNCIECFYVNDEPESKFLYRETIKLYCIVLYCESESGSESTLNQKLKQMNVMTLVWEFKLATRTHTQKLFLQRNQTLWQEERANYKTLSPGPNNKSLSVVLIVNNTATSLSDLQIHRHTYLLLFLATHICWLSQYILSHSQTCLCSFTKHQQCELLFSRHPETKWTRIDLGFFNK